VDLTALEQLLVHFGQLVAEQHWIKELDINPLLASPEQLIALDARVVIYGPEYNENQLPHLSIRPYPSQYISHWISKGGMPIVFRPIRAEDEPMLVRFHGTLSDRSVYLRYMRPMLLMDRVAHDRLSRICHADYDRDLTLIAEYEDPQTNEHKILGAGRISKLHGLEEARFTLLISDSYQGHGLGSELLNRVIEVARQEKLKRIETIVTSDNQVMIHLCQRYGFTTSPMNDGELTNAELVLA
jgi:acetyltransferase